MTLPNPHAPDTRNLILALVLGTLIMGLWQYFYVRPLEQEQLAYRKQQEAAEAARRKLTPPSSTSAETDTDAAAPASREAIIAEEASTRLKISSPTLHGSLSLKGARIDDLTLAEYRETTDKKSPEVVLLSPQRTDNLYFAEFGWLSNDPKLTLPGKDTLWEADAKTLRPNAPVTLRWVSPEGLTFVQKITLDSQYLFTVTQEVKNASGKEVTLFPYARIQRRLDDNHKHFAILHEGPLGVFGDALQNVTYKDLREDGEQRFDTQKGWFGFTDKYWLTALVPEAGRGFSTTMKRIPAANDTATAASFQVDYRAEAVRVTPGETTQISGHLFAGAKKVAVLDDYRMRLGFPLFDRAVDFGRLYFLTKPIFITLDFLYGFVGNFGVAILILTVLIKALMYPLANKSYVAMSQMKVLTPKIKDLQERFRDDKMRMNTELMNLYKTEKVNPMSGCLPILIQIPVFFALYKVLFVTIEMRHAPFFGWIHDLSAPDPTNLFTLFGLLDWNAPGFLHLGVWPIVMCATMVIQQHLNPKPTDPVQAQVIQWMPFVFLFMFASFPAGLVIYWAWNNTLSIIQQRIILHRVERKKALTGHVG